MLYVHIEREYYPHGKITVARVVSENWQDDPWAQNRNDWRTYEEAAEVAAALNRSHHDLHRTFQATDAGAWVSPRYDVIDMPQIGSEVSCASFNGDYYPAGRIVHMSSFPECRVITAKDDKGRVCKFYRRHRDGKPTGGAWVMDKTWSMIEGRHNRMNQEF